MALSAVLVWALWGSGTHAATYDMDRFLREPHPFTQPYVPPAPAASRNVTPAPQVSVPAATPRPVRPPMPAQPSSAVPSPAVAQAPSAPPRPVPPPSPGSARPAEDGSFLGIFSEVRGGVFAHDVGFFGTSKEDGVDINGEILFASPWFTEIIWSPRPTIGGSVNTGGHTSQGYAGLTWEFGFLENGFFNFFWGGAVHDGERTTNDPDSKELGCPLLFREGIDIGWRFAGKHALMAHFSHISNANLCDKNEGLDTAGIRYGYRF